MVWIPPSLQGILVSSPLIGVAVPLGEDKAHQTEAVQHTVQHIEAQTKWMF